MSRDGALALADAEDEWTPRDEAELQEMAFEGAMIIYTSHGHVRWKSVESRQPAARPEGPVPLWSVEAHGERLTFSRALLLMIEEEDGGVLIGSPERRMWGAGDDVYSALRDFSETFVSVLRSYEAAAPADLSEDAQEYLASLRGLITQREAR